MDEPIIHDLDILRPPPEYVVLAGKKIDISFVPSGVAVDISNVLRRLQEVNINPDDLDESAEEGVEIMAELCALITKKQHPDMDANWLLVNTNSVQLRLLMEHITDAMNRSIASIKENESSKKSPAAGTSP